MNIPSFNLTRMTAELGDAVAERWRELTVQGAFIGGDEVSRFEASFATYLDPSGETSTVGVANGTDALIVALRALGVGAGDEVIVPAFTFIATASAVALAGARPVFADVDPETLNLDPASVAARITDRTVGVIGVHLFGRPFDVESLLGLTEEKGLWLLEDAAQAQGASVGGRRVGTFGRLTTWSFYPTKNLGAFGDAGAVTGSDPELVSLVRRVANHGRKEHYFHSDLGTNSRLDALQAAVLNLRLERLDEANRRRGEIACRYHGRLSQLAQDGEVELLVDRPGTSCVYHQYTLLADRRDELRDHLTGRGIGSAVFYPISLHLQPALKEFAEPGLALPVSERATERVLSLPMFPELTDDEVDQVGDAVAAFWG